MKRKTENKIVNFNYKKKKNWFKILIKINSI